ncbi:hypothetical protein EBB59_10210 [Lysobacter pythonis]|uniref:Transmembrane protein n=1 Tax=Solilutibacter pythonis TaxID=2483112 RepID=A0A3M2HQB4_9GAMM|nr:hypothetical protein [Lysobacter pythonis]RMH89539.1 hypothetical protein EBB59_10210 [Lysobacter pythonis]
MSAVKSAKAARPRLQSAHWFGKTCAGVVLGLVIAVAASGLFAWFGPGGIAPDGGKNQFNMWLVAPVWAGVISGVFLFRDSLRAWAWLGAVAAALSAALLLRVVTGGQ